MLKYLKPYKLDSPKRRFGEKADGGYVINEIAITGSQCLFTYGVGGTKVFEEDYVKATGNKAYLFDHTTGWPEFDVDNIKFTKEGLGVGDKCKMFKDHYDEYANGKTVLLKIDVENAEYEYFLNEDMNFLGRVCSGIILELHYIHEPMKRMVGTKILKDLSQNFYLTHIHGNNWAQECIGMDGFAVPIVLELSFVNKFLVKDLPELDRGDYPTELDFPNNANGADFKLIFNKF